jgi:hypothetical protein
MDAAGADAGALALCEANEVLTPYERLQVVLFHASAEKITRPGQKKGGGLDARRPSAHLWADLHDDRTARAGECPWTFGEGARPERRGLIRTSSSIGREPKQIGPAPPVSQT